MSRWGEGERLLPLAEALATKFDFVLPTVPEHNLQHPMWYVSPFLVVCREHDKTLNATWARTVFDAAKQVNEFLRHYGSSYIQVFDVERQERLPIAHGVSIEYQAMKTLQARAGVHLDEETL